MKAIALRNDRKIEIVERPDPKAKGEFVVVKIHVAPLCTEYKTYRDGRTADSLGHEAAGEVVDVAQPGKVKPGDRVVVMPQSPCGQCPLCLRGDYIHCQNGRNVEQETGYRATATYAQYIIKQHGWLVPIPDGLSYEHAGMACCGLGPTFGAMQRMHVDAFDTVLITGMGPVGLGGVINGVFRGARILAVERHPYRAALARELGADAVLNPDDAGVLDHILDLTDGLGVDKAMDCSGAAPAQRLLIEAARRRGQVSFVGEGGDLTLHVSNHMIRKGLTLHGVWHYNLADTPHILRVIQASAAQLDQLITHTFPMTRVQEAWELQCTGNCGKVILKPWD